MKRLHDPNQYMRQVKNLRGNPVYKMFGRRVMRQAQQTDLALAARIAFESACRGTCNDADRDTLSGTVNICLVLAERFCSFEDLQTIIAAQEAMLRADVRMADGKSWAFDGPGRTAWLTLLDYHEQLIAQISQAELTDAVYTVQHRKNTGQVHRIEVTA